MTRACITGMIVMALSLGLFSIQESKVLANNNADKLLTYEVFSDRWALVTACSIMWC